MTEPKIDPHIRYKDVIHIWQAAAHTAVSEPGRVLLRVKCESAKHAIALNHRLNSCRKAMRGGGDSHPWDHFVINRTEAELQVCRRKEGSFVNITLADGSAVPKDLQERIKGEVDFMDLRGAAVRVKGNPLGLEE